MGRSATDRLARGVRAISDWCRRHRHQPIRDQHVALVRKVRGHNQYYGGPSHLCQMRTTKCWNEALPWATMWLPLRGE